MVWFVQPNKSPHEVTVQNLAHKEETRTRIFLEGMSFITFVENINAPPNSVSVLMGEKSETGVFMPCLVTIAFHDPLADCFDDNLVIKRYP